MSRLVPTDLSATNVESPAEFFAGFWHGIALGSVGTAALGVILFLR